MKVEAGRSPLKLSVPAERVVDPVKSGLVDEVMLKVPAPILAKFPEPSKIPPKEEVPPLAPTEKVVALARVTVPAPDKPSTWLVPVVFSRVAPPLTATVDEARFTEAPRTNVPSVTIVDPLRVPDVLS